MRRREFISLVGSAAALPLACPFGARAQPAAMPVVGYLSSKAEAVDTASIAAIREGLSEQGFVVDKSVHFTYRWSEGDYNRLSQLAAELVNDTVDAIIAGGLPAALAAKGATSKIPIVFSLAVDPVAFGLVQSFDRPGGNITGVTTLFDPLTPKKIQLLHELVPATKTVGFLLNPKNPNATSHRDYAEQAASALGLRLSVLAASRAEDIQPAFAAARKEGIGAILVGDDPAFGVFSEELISTAARSRIPTMYYVRDFVAAGGLISYGPSFEEMYKQVGGYVGRILHGAKPVELPIQQPTKIELVISTKAARALNLNIPPALVATADEVIE